MVVREVDGERVISAGRGGGAVVITGIRVGNGFVVWVRLVPWGRKAVGAGCSAVAGGDPGERNWPLSRKIRAIITTAPIRPIMTRGSRRIFVIPLRRVYLPSARKRNTSMITIMIVIMIFSQGIPSRLLPVFSRGDSVTYPPTVALAAPPLPYDIPTPGAGFFLHESIPVHWWTGGSRQSGQNVPPQYWQVNGSVHSFPQ